MMLQSENSAGKPVRTMVLQYANKEWTALQPLQGVSLLHPVLQGRRADKEVSLSDVRFSQLDEYCLISGQKDKVKRQAFLNLKFLCVRFTKRNRVEKPRSKNVCSYRQTRTVEMVFLPMLVHYTDYSPNRKSPLDVEVRPFGEKKMAKQDLTRWKEEKIVGGWSAVK